MSQAARLSTFLKRYQTGSERGVPSRVEALAGAGEGLVSSTVKDLVAGSGLRFGDRGSHALKGVPGEWL
jgi:hypothetical protein